MPNEFIIKNGYFSQGNSTITGSLRVTGSLIITGSTTSTLGFTGSLQGTSSWANNATTASYANQALSSSYADQALSSSYADQALSSSYATTASYSETSALTNNAYFAQGILAGDQLISSATDTVIQFTDQFDPQGWYDPGTYQFLPNIAGYYRISLGVWFEQPNDNTAQLNVQVRSNGSNQEMIIQQPGTTASSGISFFGTKIIYFNGTTDYIDFTAFNGTANILKIQQGSVAGSGTWFSAEYMTM